MSWTALTVGILLGCPQQPGKTAGTDGNRAMTAEGVASRAGVRPELLGRYALADRQWHGLSGLSRDQNGVLWSVPERNRHLIPVRLRAGGLELGGEPIDILGIPGGHDTEALTALGSDQFALGTETQQDHRKKDRIFLVKVEGSRALPVGQIDMDYGLWGMRADGNRGIEGLCSVDGLLVAGGETAIRKDGKRLAPIGRYDLTAKQWAPFWLPLTSSAGKISALTCRRGKRPDEIEVLAIERHYEVARLLRFDLPREGPGRTLRPELWADVAPVIPGIPNLEGLVWPAPNSVWLMVDNFTGRPRGPTELIEVRVHD